QPDGQGLLRCRIRRALRFHRAGPLGRRHIEPALLMESASVSQGTGAPHAGACGGSGTPAAVLDGRTINQAQPEHLAADLRRILVGPPRAAAATLRAAAEG